MALARLAVVPFVSDFAAGSAATLPSVAQVVDLGATALDPLGTIEQPGDTVAAAHGEPRVGEVVACLRLCQGAVPLESEHGLPQDRQSGVEVARLHESEAVSIQRSTIGSGGCRRARIRTTCP